MELKRSPRFNRVFNRPSPWFFCFFFHPTSFIFPFYEPRPSRMKWIFLLYRVFLLFFFFNCSHVSLWVVSLSCLGYFSWFALGWLGLTRLSRIVPQVLLELTKFYRVLPSFTGFYRVLPGFICFDLVLLGFTGFSWVILGFTGFYLVLLGFTKFPQSSTRVYLVLLGFTGFYQMCIKFHWILPSFICFDLVLLGFTGFYWVLLGFT